MDLTHIELNEIAHQIDVSVIRRLGLRLGLEYAEIQRYERTNNQNPSQCTGTEDMLNAWYRNGGTREQLCEALKIAEQGRLAIRIESGEFQAMPVVASSQIPTLTQAHCEPEAGLQVGSSDSSPVPVTQIVDTEKLKPLRESLVSVTAGHHEHDEWQNREVKQAHPNIDDLDDEMKYVMWKSLVKGNALIIGNSKFSGDNTCDRTWAEEDIINMTTLLKKLGYDLKEDANIKRNLSKKDMDEAVKQFTKELKHDDPQSAVVYISSHGNENGVTGTDKAELRIPTLLQHFSGVLLGKPKVIIIDACWGVGQTSRLPVSVRNDPTATPSIQQLPENADIFMIHSTSFGSVSWSYEDRGSWLVNKMCKVVFNTVRELEDLDTIMLRVTKEMHSEEAQERDTDGNLQPKGTQSTTVFKQGVTRKLFFFPGYSRPDSPIEPTV